MIGRDNERAAEIARATRDAEGRASSRSNPAAYGITIAAIAAIVVFWLSLPGTWGERVPFLALLIPVAVGGLLGGVWPGMVGALLGGIAAVYIGMPRFVMDLESRSEWVLFAIYAVQSPLTAVGCAALRRAIAQSRADRDALAAANREIQAQASERARSLEALVSERTAELQARLAERAALIAELKEAEEVARRQADLLEQSHDAILVWKIGGGIVYWNRGARELYGWSAEEAAGRSPHALLATSSTSGVNDLEAALAREGRWEGELHHRTRDGRTLVVESRHTMVRHGDEAVVLETNRDVSARALAEAEREQLLTSERAARADAERATRVKDEFLGTLSHELRTPLHAMIGWIAMLRRGAIEGEAIGKAIGVLDRNARALMALIEDLLDISRISAGKLRLDVQDVHLADVVEGAVASIAPSAAAKSIRVEKILDSAAIHGDPVRVQQIVWNLLSNAVKFTPKAGRVRVLLRRVESCAEIVVSDTGQGIRREFLPHLFERFRQQDASTTRAHGGLGLGLSLVRHLVELHGGTVSADSEGEGRGATFTVRLPLAACQRGPASAELIVPCDLKGVKVLVVDDEVDARELLQRILEGYDAEVVAVGSAPEALDEIARFRPDVLLSDIGMPQQDGYQLLRRVRTLRASEGGRTPAAALTAFARPEDRRRALHAGYQIHVAKPVDASELVTVVAHLAGRLVA